MLIVLNVIAILIIDLEICSKIYDRICCQKRIICFGRLCDELKLLIDCRFKNLFQCLRKVAKFIAEQNQTIYEPHNLHITDPVERGLRVVSF